ncbi:MULTISPECIES: hypothetical protein [Bacillus]|uniref:hypothetical protein n=1 Tax=Bacillus TaxID=1386 RepID=UPI00047AD54D|nr:MULTISPECIES: hypothetical protein [Bacillus]WIY60070.1 hypothetical protein QRY57_19890 [Bacillus arachidis]SDY46252.1 hypothetical protein SAMN04488156_101506 [Bacillus sp. 166amftsu]
MKVWKSICILCSSIVLLSGCFQKEEKKEVKKETIPETTEYGGKELKKVGQAVKEKGWGTFKLEQLKHVNQTFEVLPMKIHVQDVKVIALSQMSQDAKDTLKVYTALTPEEVQRRLGDKVNREDAELYASLSGKDIADKVRYVEITYKVENSGDKDMQFFSINDVTINGTQQFNVPKQNFLYEEDTLVDTKNVTKEEYKRGETREGIIGLILDDENKEITQIAFTTDVLVSNETHDIVAEPQTFNISLSK